jgi:type IV pilus assembly protein PilC
MPPKMKSIRPPRTPGGGGPKAEPKKKARKALSLGGVSRKKLTQFTSQFAILQDAGLPVVRCLRILEGQLPQGLLKATLMQIVEDVEGGSSLSDAMAKHPRVFDPLYVNMTKAGEAGGVLDTILLRLSDFMEKAQRIRRRILSASIYPAVVLSVATGILLLIMIFVVPKFEQVFESLGSGVELPAITRGLQSVSRFLVEQYGWALILGIPVLFWLTFRLMRATRAGGFLLDRMKLRMPLFGRLIRKTLIARFARTFGTLISSGVPILEALNIVRGAITNAVLQKAIGDVHDAIREGENIAEPLGQSKIFDDIVVNMIDVGEETGELDKMLLKVADTYENEVDEEVGVVIGLLEPALIVLMGGAVFFIVLALFMPLLQIVDKIKV